MHQSLSVMSLLLGCVFGLPQLPGSTWESIAEKSTSVIVATVGTKAWIVRTDKMVSRQETLPGGNVIVEIPNPHDYVVGSLYRVHVEQILKRDRRVVRVGGTTTIFVSGFVASPHVSAVLLEGKRYLLFLAPLKDAEGYRFSGTKVHTPGTKSSRDRDFNPASSFAVVQASNGAIEITETNLKIIDEVRTSLDR